MLPGKKHLEWWLVCEYQSDTELRLTCSLPYHSPQHMWGFLTLISHSSIFPMAPIRDFFRRHQLKIWNTKFFSTAWKGRLLWKLKRWRSLPTAKCLCTKISRGLFGNWISGHQHLNSSLSLSLECINTSANDDKRPFLASGNFMGINAFRKSSHCPGSCDKRGQLAVCRDMIWLLRALHRAVANLLSC